MSDLQAVMDFLEAQHKDHQFILMGICTGARNAQCGMAMDARVIGAVCIDGHIYKTLRYYIHFYGQVFSFKSWIRLFNKMRKQIMRKPVSGESQNISAFGHSYQSKKQTEMDFKKFIDRGVSLQCIFTGRFCRYESQLADNFKNIDFGENIEVSYLRNSEHVFPLMEDRENLTAVIVDWLNRNFRFHTH